MFAEFYEDLRKAGAVWGLLGPSVSPDEFYGAQFVQVIERLRQEKGASECRSSAGWQTRLRRRLK